MSILFGVMLSGPLPLTSSYIPLSQWEATEGDRFIVDTSDNMGYLVHESGNYTSFRVGSGRKEVVRYIGKVYNASTPEGYWAVKSTSVFGDHVTFGKTGRFLRLYEDGKIYTSYGIHATDNIDEILVSDDRYRSYGCVLVSNAVLDILEETYKINKEVLEVVTTESIGKSINTAAVVSR